MPLVNSQKYRFLFHEMTWFSNLIDSCFIRLLLILLNISKDVLMKMSINFHTSIIAKNIGKNFLTVSTTDMLVSHFVSTPSPFSRLS
jgi:hypothetical protein